MISGERVEVVSFIDDGIDALGNVIKKQTLQSVDRVVVFPGARKDASDDNRPQGVIVAYTLHFPKSYKGDLTGCEILVRGHKCKVIGSPDREPEPCPTKWNMTVEVSYVEG